MRIARRPHLLMSALLAAGVLLPASGAFAAAGRQLVQETPEAPAPTGVQTPALSPVTFAVIAGEISAGGRGEVRIGMPQAVPLSEGTLILSFDPPPFVDNPTISFSDQVPDGSVSIKSPSPGVYVIYFTTRKTPLIQTTRGSISLSAFVRDDLPIGSSVGVSLTARGRTARGHAIPLSRWAGNLIVTPDEGLVLRVNDASNLVPGQTVDVVIRTYNPRPITQGQVDLLLDTRFFGPVTSLAVYGAEPDVEYSADLSVPGRVRITFQSPSASINRIDGPMIFVRLTLSGSLRPGAQSVIQVDATETRLLDQRQNPVHVDGRQGKFTIAQ